MEKNSVKKTISSGERLKENLKYVIRRTFWVDHHFRNISKDEMEKCMQKVNNLILKKYKQSKSKVIYLSLREIAEEIRKTYITDAVINAILEDEIIDRDPEQRTININDFYESIRKEYQEETEKEIKDQSTIKLESLNKIIHELKNLGIEDKIVESKKEEQKNLEVKKELEIENKEVIEEQKVKKQEPVKQNTNLLTIEDIKVLLVNYYKIDNIDLRSIKLEVIIDILNNKSRTYYINGKLITLNKEIIDKIINNYQETLVNEYIESLEKQEESTSVNKRI